MTLRLVSQAASTTVLLAIVAGGVACGAPRLGADAVDEIEGERETRGHLLAGIPEGAWSMFENFTGDVACPSSLTPHYEFFSAESSLAGSTLRPLGGGEFVPVWKTDVDLNEKPFVKGVAARRPYLKTPDAEAIFFDEVQVKHITDGTTLRLAVKPQGRPFHDLVPEEKMKPLLVGGEKLADADPRYNCFWWSFGKQAGFNPDKPVWLNPDAADLLMSYHFEFQAAYKSKAALTKALFDNADDQDILVLRASKSIEIDNPDKPGEKITTIVPGLPIHAVVVNKAGKTVSGKLGEGPLLKTALTTIFDFYDSPPGTIQFSVLYRKK